MNFGINFGFLVFLGVGIGLSIAFMAWYIKGRMFRQWKRQFDVSMGREERSGKDRRQNGAGDRRQHD